MSDQKQLGEGQKMEDLPVSYRAVSVFGWNLTPRTATVVKVAAIVPLLSAVGWLLQNFLQLRGFVNLLASRIDLAVIVLCLSLAGCVLTMGMRHKRRWRISTFAVLVVAAILVDWLVPKPQVAATSQRVPSSSLAFSREFTFPFNKLWPGDWLRINMYYRNVSPNEVDVVNVLAHVCVEPDTSIASQQHAIGNFRKFIANVKEMEDSIGKRYMAVFTMQTTEGKFFTAEGCTESVKWVGQLVTQSLLDDLQSGKQVIFALTQIDFKNGDGDNIHHLRKCAFLLPPAQPPGTWQLCGEGFNRSD